MSDPDAAVPTASQSRPGLLSRRLLLGGAAGLTAVRPGLSQQAQPPPLSPLLAELWEKAKPEREVTIWGAGAPNLYWLPEHFGRRFPGMTVNWMGSQQASARLIAESRAGRDTVDVWSFSLGGTLEVQRRGLLVPQDWASLGADGEATMFDGEAVAQHNYVFAPIYPTNRLPASEHPARWDQLLDERWTNRMVASTFLLPRMTGYLAIAWGEDRAERWMRAMLEQQRTMITTAQVNDILMSGERALAPAENTAAAYQMTKAGFDTSYLVLDLIAASQFVLAVLKKAPHPNAARLLIAWLLSPEGKRLNESVVGYHDIRGDPNSSLRAQIAQAGSRVIYEDMATMTARAEYYRRFSLIVRGLSGGR